MSDGDTACAMPLAPPLAHPLAPGATIGILGGGQLGRMLAVAAAQLGMRAHIYSDQSGPAFDVAAAATIGRYDDYQALGSFARSVDVVTYEFENVPVTAAAYIDAIVPVRPGTKALQVAQDRLVEKEFLSGLGISVAPYAVIDKAADLTEALAAFSAPAILKTRRLGYDGKGQVALSPGKSPGTDEAMALIGEMPAVLEQRLVFDYEISVLVVRSSDGQLAYYDCPQNFHENGILCRSTVPSKITEEQARAAKGLAAAIARALDYVGLLAIELFVTADGQGAKHGERLGSHGTNQKMPALIVNELAPRVHNSGHWTHDACAVSQFENHIRAVAGWPLGNTSRHSNAVMENLIGDQIHDWQRLADEPSACVHVYGKNDARPGRKMGHVTYLTAKS